MNTFQLLIFTFNTLPCSVFISCQSTRSPDRALPDTTWYVSMLMRSDFFSGVRREDSVLDGIFANASFVGANTVNGPPDAIVSTRPPALSAATSVENIGLETAVSAILGMLID
jgi:hypothetical protein